MNSIISNAFDMHVHSGPDVLPRKMDDMEMAKRIVNSGMNGYIIKSHYFCSADRASLVKDIYPECNAVGAICLNSTVGGINPAAVELAALAGARLVWLPTCDSAHEQEMLFDENGNIKATKLPFWAKIVIELRERNIYLPPIRILEDGKLTESTLDVLDTIAKHEMILATSHVSHEEAFAVVKEAKKRGVKRIVITHATFPTTFYTVDEQKELIRNGAYIEHCYTTYATGKVDFETIAEQIRAVGPEHVVMGTDLGMSTNIYPDEGMLKFSEDLIKSGFSEKEVMMMNGDTPRMLISK